MYVLGFESSCDETSAAVLEAVDGELFVRSNIVASQIPVHRLYGGVVPEIASRAHVEVISRITREALDEAEKRDVYSLFLEVRESNEAAIALYRSVGFREIFLRENYYRDPTEAALVMTIGRPKETT